MVVGSPRSQDALRNPHDTTSASVSSYHSRDEHEARQNNVASGGLDVLPSQKLLNMLRLWHSLGVVDASREAVLQQMITWAEQSTEMLHEAQTQPQRHDSWIPPPVVYGSRDPLLTPKNSLMFMYQVASRVQNDSTDKRLLINTLMEIGVQSSRQEARHRVFKIMRRYMSGNDRVLVHMGDTLHVVQMPSEPNSADGGTLPPKSLAIFPLSEGYSVPQECPLNATSAWADQVDLADLHHPSAWLVSTLSMLLLVAAVIQAMLLFVSNDLDLNADERKWITAGLSVSSFLIVGMGKIEQWLRSKIEKDLVD